MTKEINPIPYVRPVGKDQGHTDRINKGVSVIQNLKEVMLKDMSAEQREGAMLVLKTINANGGAGYGNICKPIKSLLSDPQMK